MQPRSGTHALAEACGGRRTGDVYGIFVATHPRENRRNPSTRSHSAWRSATGQSGRQPGSASVSSEQRWRRHGRILLVACKNGRVKLTVDRDRQLFVDSAGSCLLCQTSLFPDSPRGRSISIAERAHIVAHSPAGPRGGATPNDSPVDDPANLVLLCPTCHTKVDKAPDEYPATVLLDLKSNRAAAVARIGGIVTFSNRADARAAVEVLLSQNRETFNHSGPDKDDGSFPTLEAAAKWRELVLTEIVPRNELLISLVEVNSAFATNADRLAAEELRAHTRDLAAKHRGRPLLAPSQRFPAAAESIFSEPDAS